MSGLIRTENLEKEYRDSQVAVRALAGVSLEFQPGEFTAVVGPSGSGKTTLFNCIGGLDSPTGGRVWVGGTEMTRLSDSRLIAFRLWNIGFVFQAYNLIPVLSAEENVELVMVLQKVDKSRREERVRALMAKVGLGNRLHNRPAELSGGEQQRVSVARALASNPKFVLADEPTANLDSASAGNLLDIMAELNRQEGTTFLFSTHDARVVERARRVITLRDGAVIGDENR